MSILKFLSEPLNIFSCER